MAWALSVASRAVARLLANFAQRLDKGTLAITTGFVQWLDKDFTSHTSGMPNTKEAGQAVAHYRNGKVKFRGSWLEGEMHGAWEWFRTDGSLMRTGQFDRGRQTGTWRTYDRAGRVLRETTFGR